MSGRGRAVPVVAAATGGTPRAPALSFPKHNRQDRVARQVRPVPTRASAGASLAVPPAPLPSSLLPPPPPALRQRLRAAGRRQTLRRKERNRTKESNRIRLYQDATTPIHAMLKEGTHGRV